MRVTSEERERIRRIHQRIKDATPKAFTEAFFEAEDLISEIKKHNRRGGDPAKLVPERRQLGVLLRKMRAIIEPLRDLHPNSYAHQAFVCMEVDLEKLEDIADHLPTSIAEQERVKEFYQQAKEYKQ